MSRVGLDWYKREPQAYLGDVQGLTAKEHAVYSVVIDLLYVHGGSIRNDPKWIAGWISDMGSSAVRKSLTSLDANNNITIEISDSEISREDINRFSLFSRASRPPIPNDIREYVFARDGEECVYCADTVGPFELDHVTPWSRGGDHEIDNLVVCCRTCNRKKSDRTPIEMGWAWRRYEWNGNPNWRDSP